MCDMNIILGKPTAATEAIQADAERAGANVLWAVTAAGDMLENHTAEHAMSFIAHDKGNLGVINVSSPTVTVGVNGPLVTDLKDMGLSVMTSRVDPDGDPNAQVDTMRSMMTAFS